MVCVHCRRLMFQDETWKPYPGLDPLMRKFRCLACNRVVYAFKSGSGYSIPDEQLTGWTKYGES